ncbi:MAG: hypothetical protein Q8L55_11325 [Phycisphaerales bacterium]|nr:hypothetical protein [Phycisphaerales bacterium]
MKKVQQLFNTVRRGLFGSGAKSVSPLGLVTRAGRMAGADSDALMEQLEKREYLFVLTVDQANPTFQADPARPNYGTVTANFAYFLPFLRSDLPAIGDPAAFPSSGVGDATSAGPGIVFGPTDPVTLDTFALPRNRMSAWLEARMAGVQITLYGRFQDDPNTPAVELPTSIQIFDLYGRDMQQRLDIGRPSPVLGLLDLGVDNGRPAGPGNNPVAIPPTAHDQVDPDDVEAIGDRGDLVGTLPLFNQNGLDPAIGDGVPDMNDGLGMIVFINSDPNVRLGMVSGQAVRITDQASFDRSDIVDFDTFYGIDIPEGLDGLTDWWDEQGFGFGMIPGSNPPDVSGLPAFGGSILFGAPFIRDNTDSITYFGFDNNNPRPAVLSALPANPLVLNFTSQQLASGPLTIDGVTINTPIVGIRTLRADQAVGSINVPGIMMGTVNVSGSLGLFFAQHMLGTMNVTGDVGQIYVGGTLGYWVRGDQIGDTQNLDNLRGTGSSINVGGRLGTLFVAGRSRANVFVVGDTLNPRQRIEGSVYNEVETIFGIDPAIDVGLIAPTINTGIIRAGAGMYRNDGFATAEFIFSGLSGTTINGSLGLMDPLNEEDVADFYAFAADSGRTVQFNVIFPNPLAAQNAGQAYVRVFDQNGNLVATHQGAGATPADTTNPTQPRTGFNFQFQAQSTGVYYLVIGTPGDDNFQSSLQYTITMAGQAATTLGQMITGGGIGGSTVSVQTGAVGRISGGQGVIGGDGAAIRAESDNSGIPDADYIDSAGFNISVPTIYNFQVGGDVGGGLFTASGVIGGIQIAGGVMGLTINAARQLGSFVVGGQTGVQEVTNLSRTAGQTGAVVIRTGSNGVPGHIGLLQFGDLVRGDQFTLQTSAGSFVDVLEVLQGGFTQQQATFNLGQGSDIRFASFPSVRLANPGQQDIDYFLPLIANTPLTLTDDSGVTFRITVTGNGSFGTLRVAPAGQLGGVIVGRIDVTLAGNGDLIISTTSAGSLALGEINVTTQGGTGNDVRFTGPAEIDVRFLSINGVITELSNTTPDGDLVSVDVGGVRRVNVFGSIGSTRTYMLSPDDVAIRVNLVQGLSPVVGSPIGIPANLINAWEAGTDVPFVFGTADADERALEDSGSPIDNILNGIVIRTGNVDLITARGSIGDVITQGGNGGTGQGGRVLSIIANNDRVNTTGRFEGITGSIFVGEINSLDVGDGVLGPGSTPFARAGVFAIDDIVTVRAGYRVLNPVLTGALFIAGNANAAPNDNSQGISNLLIRGASLDRAFVHVANLDSWWRSARYGGDRVEPSGSIANVTITSGNVTRTDFHALAIGRISITGGRWDASSAQATLSIGSVNADSFTSSLSDRDPLQFYFNQIRAGLDVTTIRVNNVAVGNIEDLFVSAGRNNTAVSAHDIIRSNISIRGNAGTFTVRGDIRASAIGSGRLASMQVTGDITASTISISGAILNLTAGGSIVNTEIVSSGPDGRINNLTAVGGMTGTVTSSGPIGTIRTTRGDINLAITTTDPTDGSINSITSGRDLVLRLDLADGTTVNTLRAARHIGRRMIDGTTPDLIDVPGNVQTIIAGGVVYSDVRAGGTIGTVTSGRALAYLPTADYATDAVITASGRITTVNINGDFNGSVVSYSGGIGSVTITNGSFRAGDSQRFNRIEARDGDITSVRIVNGHLLGDILAPQGSILSVFITGGAVFGDIGINPTLFAAAPTQTGVPLAERRTQLPPGATPTGGRDGPIIAAGVNIGTITTTGGIFEASISAGRTINSITVGRGIDDQGAVPTTDQATFIIAGDRITTLTVNQLAQGTFVGAGVTALGDNAQPGGIGADADTVKSGTVGTVNFRAGTDGVTVSAGLVAGADGLFNTLDDMVAPGISEVSRVTVVGTASNTAVLTDSGTPIVSANLLVGTNTVGGQALPVAEGFALAAGAIPGVNVPVTSAGIIVTIGGQLRRVVFTGAGTATYTAANVPGVGTGVLVLDGSTTASTLTISAAPAGSVSVGSLTNIVGRDDASLRALNATVDISTLTTVLDGTITTVSARNLTNSPVRTGQSLGNFTAGVAGSNTPLTVESRGTIGSVRILGGVQAGLVPSSLRGLSIGTVRVGGSLQGSVSSQRDITSATVTGAMVNGSGIRAGYNLGSTVVGSMATSTISAGGNIASVRVSGNVTDSAILAGVDLGQDANFGGAGVNADRVSNGNLGTVTITGSFVRSDIGAGVYQGADGFLGTQDDLLGEGRSTMGNVTISGSAIGSLLNTESFRIMSNGTMGNVRAQGLPFNSAQNLLVVNNKAQPDPLQVTGVDVSFIGGVYFATIMFNQPVAPSTLSGALSISEIRGAEPIATLFPLIENVDYTVTYSAGATSAVVQFSQNVTTRDLDTGGAVPVPDAAASPGIFRFTLDSAVLRGQTAATLLDGDGDGVAETLDSWSEDFVVGDAGDRFLPNVGTAGDLSNIDFYGPVNLDVVMSRNATAQPDTADINRTYRIQGFLGDHPDNSGTFFQQGSDADVYVITMRAGQVLSTSLSFGGGSVSILAWNRGNIGDPGDDTLVDLTQAGNGISSPLTDGNIMLLQDTQVFLVVLSVADTDPFLAPPGPGQPPAIIGDPQGGQATVVNQPASAAIGAYTLSVRIVDDGDNGFAGTTQSGNGSVIETAPLPAAFAGVDGILGTQDDLASITVGEFIYQLDPGTNNRLDGNGTLSSRSDDRVVGVNPYGTEHISTAGADGVFGTADDLTTINSAIGEMNAIGATVVNATDLDIFHLNGGAAIVAGERFRFTLRVSEFGGDLGSLRTPRPTPGGGVGVQGGDNRGEAQFALFETTPGGGINAGALVAQAPNPEGYRGTPNTVTASDGSTTYGYDANGDFYMEITIPPSQANGALNGAFSLYVQGAHQSNYTVEVLNVGAGPVATAQSQNFLIETNGGLVNWLDAFGTSVLDRYSGSVNANVPGLGAPTREYILNSLIANLNSIFTAAGVNVVVSLTSADFVGQSFSTVFVTDSLEPADQINQNFFGVSERRDVLNANRNDQAVVFAPAVTALGNTVDQAGIDSYVLSLTSAVAQRMGELLGLTFALGGGMTNSLPAAAGALTVADLEYNAADTRLAQVLRSNFILGNQNDTQLLRRIFQLTT